MIPKKNRSLKKVRMSWEPLIKARRDVKAGAGAGAIAVPL